MKKTALFLILILLVPTVALARFTDNGNGTVTDTRTGLIWQQATAPGTYTWKQALAYCENLSLGGYSDWRLPTIKELASIVDYSIPFPGPCINTNYFPNTTNLAYGSSTTSAYYTYYAWGMDFSYGYDYNVLKSNDNYVRAVRGGQSGALGDSVISVLPASTGNAPFSAEFTLTSVNIDVDHYAWDFDNDGNIDSVTMDNRITHLFNVEGDYTVKGTVVGRDGTSYDKLVLIHVLPAEPVNQTIRFVPFYPSSNDIPSLVMKGGKAIRWYRVLDEADNPVTGKRLEFKYTLVTGDYSFSADIDDQGFVCIETPPVTDSGDYRLTVTDESGGTIALQVVDNPDFHVEVVDRSFIETYKLLVGLGGSFGYGAVGAQVGPVGFKTLTAGLYGGRDSSTRLRLKTKGDATDLEVQNKIDTSGGVEAFAGISAGLLKTYINTKGRPMLSAGAGFKGGVNAAMSTSHEFDDFTNNDRFDHNDQLLAEAALFFENLINNSLVQQNNVLADKVLQAIIGRVTRIDDYYESTGASYGFNMSSSLGAEFRLKNPLGISAGMEPVIKADAFDVSYLYERKDDAITGGLNKMTQSVTAKLDIGTLIIGISQKFGGDRRRNDTPRLKVDFINTSLLSREGEESLSIEKGGTEEQIELRLLIDRTGANTYFLNSSSVEDYLIFRADDLETVDSVSRGSDFIRQNRAGGDIELKSASYINAAHAFLGIDSGRVVWEKRKKEVHLISIPIEFGLTLGLHLGLKFDVDTESTLEYAAEKGVILPDKGMLKTEAYEKDSRITDNIRGWQAVLNEYRELINGIIPNILQTVEKIKEKAEEAVVQTGKTLQEGGAKLQASASAFADNVKLKITSFWEGVRTYRVLAMDSAGSATYTAFTIGNIFVVNVSDEAGNPITAFSTPLDLSIGYTDADLQAAGFTPDDAAKLRIYVWDEESGYYLFVGGVVDTAQYCVTAAITSPGQYVLAIDDVAPQILNFNTSNTTSTPHINFSINDNLSGVNTGSVRILLDGVECINGDNYSDYFNAHTGVFDWQIQEALAKGDHVVEITIGDTAGNIESRDYTITVDDTPPSIVHTPVTEAAAGAALEISADVSDDNGVQAVLLHYRPKTGEAPYQVVEMTNTEASQTYVAGIPSQYLTSFGVRYYINAIDTAGNETSLDSADIEVADETGPVIAGGLSKSVDENGIRVAWNPAEDVDLAGYRIYLGQTPDSLNPYKDNGDSNWAVLDGSYFNFYVAVAAYDAEGNEGPGIRPEKLSPCIPGDMDCNARIELSDAIMALKVVAGMPVSGDALKFADVNEDSRVGSEEIIYILQYLAGMEAPSAGSLIKSSVLYNSAPEYNASDLENLVDGFSDFTVDFYHAVAVDPEFNGKNIFFSTYSIENALAMTWAGAKNNTAAEMAAALHLALPQETFHSTLTALNVDINSRDDQPPPSGDAFSLNLVNALWSRNGYPFLDGYLDLLAQNYDAGVRVLDFYGNPDGSRQIINGWVEDQTQEKIKDLLPDGSITSDTAVVLTNAVYFKASWYLKFDEELSAPGDFTRLDNTIVMPEMMHQNLDVKYVRESSFDAVSIPYVSPRYEADTYPDEFSMILIIPHAGEFEAVENSLDYGTIDSIAASVAMGDVNLTLPKFTFACEIQCRQILRNLGMNDAFDSSAADFSGMVNPADSKPWIDQVYHKAFVAVDEQGTEAAAATAVVMKETAVPDPVAISADKPFIFLIRDNITGLILFMGRMLDPTE